MDSVPQHTGHNLGFIIPCEQECIQGSGWALCDNREDTSQVSSFPMYRSAHRGLSGLCVTAQGAHLGFIIPHV